MKLGITKKSPRVMKQVFKLHHRGFRIMKLAIGLHHGYLNSEQEVSWVVMLIIGFYCKYLKVIKFMMELHHGSSKGNEANVET